MSHVKHAKTCTDTWVGRWGEGGAPAYVCVELKVSHVTYNHCIYSTNLEA